MVDKPKLDSLLTRLKSYVEVLTRLGHVPRDQFLSDPDKIGNAKYHFVIAIECCIDVANHIIASERLRIPEDSADSFRVLVENGICPAELDESLRAMVKFRNRLVHLYWRVDNQLVASYLQSVLGAFDRFARAVSAAFP